MVLCEDVDSLDIWNAVMYVKNPENKFLLFCILEISNCIHNEVRGENPLDITGPQRLGKLFRQYFKQMPKHGKNTISGLKMLFLKMELPDTKVFHNQRLLMMRHEKYNGLRRHFKKQKLTNVYWDLWRKGNVYSEINLEMNPFDHT